MLLALVKYHLRFWWTTGLSIVSYALCKNITVLSDDNMSVKLFLCVSLQNQNILTACC